MTAKIISKDNNNLLIEWEDEEKGFGKISMKWDSKINKYILDSEYLAVSSVLEIFKVI